MADKDILADKKILFVEDDAFFSNMIASKLKPFGCDLTITTNGRDAFAALAKEAPNLILLDLLLPGDMDGFAILEKIKADPNLKDVPVVVLSNLNRSEDIDRVIKLGAFRYLTKALVTPTEIVGNIESVLTIKKL